MSFIEFFELTKSFLVLVQKLRDRCKSSLNLGHADTITLKKVPDQYEKETFIQVETL